MTFVRFLLHFTYENRIFLIIFILFTYEKPVYFTLTLTEERGFGLWLLSKPLNRSEYVTKKRSKIIGSETKIRVKL